MVDAGLPVLQAVRAATAEAADLLGMADRGVLRQGAAAGVLVVAGDVAAGVDASSARWPCSRTAAGSGPAASWPRPRGPRLVPGTGTGPGRCNRVGRRPGGRADR